MSIVGNRPLPLYEAELLTSDAYIDRFMAPSGLTGLWQVEKRGGAGKMSAEERKQLDIKYAQEFIRVLVGEHCGRRGQHRRADKVLRRDQLDVAPLAVVLCLNRRPYLGVLSGKKLHDILDQIRLHLSQI